MNNKIGYNMIAGGNNRTRRQEVTDKIAAKNRNPSPETRMKMSIASTGRRHSQETIEKIKQSNLGQKRSEETKKNISIAKQNISDETRRKISIAGMGRKIAEKCIELNRTRLIGNKLRARPISQYDLKGNFIRSWDCAMDAEKEINVNHANIASCCNGKSKSVGGYQWKYFNGNTSNISEAKRKSYNRRVIQFTKDRKYIKTWNSVTEAGNYYNLASGNIAKCCNGKINSCGGYIWKYEDNNVSEAFVKRKIVQFDNQLCFIKKWDSISDASKELKLKYSAIMSCCKNKSNKSSTGFIWRYIEDVDDTILKGV